MNGKFKTIDSGIGKLRYHMLNPHGIVIATFRDLKRAEQSAEVMNNAKELQDFQKLMERAQKHGS